MRTRLALLIAGGLAVAGCGGRASDAEPTPTFAEHVGPLLHEHCAPCHRPGQGTPFSLLSYDDAQRRASRIARAVSGGHMPPWLPEPNVPEFVGARRLAPDAIATIRRWAESGAPEGPRDALPPVPRFPDGWQLGTPDLVVRPAAAYTLAPGDADVFRNMVIPMASASGRFVRAVEFQTGGAPVHHAVVHIDRTTASRRLDGADGHPGFDGMGARDAQDPEGHFLGWAPGRGPIVAPDRMPWRLDPNTDLVLELHLVPGDRPVDVLPAVALYFSDTPPDHVPVLFKMGSKAIDIPAGEANYTVEDRFVLPTDVDLLSLYPHAHYLGREMQVTAQLPDGSHRSLLHIRRWDFRWQQDYRYVEPIALPRGTTIAMRFTYDNSAGNEDNLRRPPQQVICGPQSTDEMGNLGVQVLPRSPADRRILRKATDAHDAQVNLAGAEMLVRNNPFSAETRTFLAASYIDVGRVADAMPHLEVALGLDRRSVNTWNELGGARMAQGRADEALVAFRQAATLAPDDDRMHFNVGIVLARLGRAGEAARAFERALALNPGYADAHGELGVLLFAAGRRNEAIAHLTRAVTLSPDTARLQSDLGGVLASAGRLGDARVHFERALALDPDYTPARENLARLAAVQRR
ncbi:MAG: tetratricopeptide repeat protein [Acidobacteria bacterium]|nr:tetratricopeptide repeat protein [Acidobacteriota bacterium]